MNRKRRNYTEHQLMSRSIVKINHIGFIIIYNTYMLISTCGPKQRNKHIAKLMLDRGFIYKEDCLSVSVYLSVCLCLYVCCPPVYPSVSTSVDPSVRPSVLPSIRPSVSMHSHKPCVGLIPDLPESFLIGSPVAS